MALTTRRNVLKGIAGASVTTLARAVLPGAAASLVACGQECFTLNVILHGLFLLDFRQTYIKLLAPDVCGHIYRAGNWDKNYIYELGREPCRLKGLKNIPSRFDIRNDFLLIVRKKDIQYPGFQINEFRSRINIDLPFPNEIRPLRVQKGCVHFAGKDGGLFKAMGMSLCPVLIYRGATPNLKLGDSKWQYWMNDDKSNSANLHIWAEPEERTDPEHAEMGYEELRKLTCPELDFSLTADASPPIDCSVDLPGVEAYEEQGWAEWSSGAEGTRPVNCNPHIFA